MSSKRDIDGMIVMAIVAGAIAAIIGVIAWRIFG